MASGEKYLTYSEATTIAHQATKSLGFSNNVGYNPFLTYDSYLSLLNSDGTYAVTGMTGNQQEVDETNPSLLVKFKSLGVQNILGSNNWYPSMIAGRQYANMRVNNVLPVYYSQYALLNPGVGKAKAKDFILVINGTEYSLAQAISKL